MPDKKLIKEVLMENNEQAVDTSSADIAPVVEQVETPEAATPDVSAEGQTTAPVAEKMIPQSQVSKIAAREARSAAEKATREAQAYYERQAQQASQPPVQNMGGVQQHTQDDMRRMIQEEAYKMSQHAMANQIESEWLSTMNAEKDSDPEFAQLYDDLNIEAQPHLILWMNSLDNKASVVKDIAKNPSKYAQILMLANGGSPNLAKAELQKLSASIKANQVAQQQAQVAAPLSQLKPSNIGSDNGNMSVKDYMAIFRG